MTDIKSDINFTLNPSSLKGNTGVNFSGYFIGKGNDKTQKMSITALPKCIRINNNLVHNHYSTL